MFRWLKSVFVSNRDILDYLDVVFLFLQEWRTQMSLQLDELAVAVAAMTTTTESAITLINGLADQIEDLKDDPAQLQALADTLRADTTKLSDAVVANTPTP